MLYPKSPVYFSNFLGNEGEHDGHSTSYWMREMNSADDETRWHAIFSLGAIGAKAGDAVPGLAKILRDHPDGRTRSEAALALTKMAPASKPAVPSLADALSDKDFFVRWNAAMALFQLHSEARPAVPALINAVKDKKNKTNLNTFPSTIDEVAALALGRASAGTPDGVPVLLEALKNAEAPVTRMAMTRALGEVGPEAKAAVPQLQLMCKDSDFWVREAAKESLRKIEGSEAEPAGKEPPRERSQS
jgi:HEAT repeat protein